MLLSDESRLTHLNSDGRSLFYRRTGQRSIYGVSLATENWYYSSLSQDLNPIEHIWEELNGRFQRRSQNKPTPPADIRQTTFLTCKGRGTLPTMAHGQSFCIITWQPPSRRHLYALSGGRPGKHFGFRRENCHVYPVVFIKDQINVANKNVDILFRYNLCAYYIT